ncbi:uncharacterized protein LOC116347936 [Contarinia nasturtii]|uniref:uncharacterized protein LOC116347936 n=1 Tax=Contarinia nasturtii TaxID=265458 RepID=UPI0012D4A7D9|nr:uncharacterized protein LOC116347936 [Contarinia nasturtii]
MEGRIFAKQNAQELSNYTSVGAKGILIWDLEIIWTLSVYIASRLFNTLMWFRHSRELLSAVIDANILYRMMCETKIIPLDEYGRQMDEKIGETMCDKMTNGAWYDFLQSGEYHTQLADKY